MSDYLADVQRYDAGADADVVEKIVKHLGIALRSRSTAFERRFNSRGEPK